MKENALRKRPYWYINRFLDIVIGLILFILLFPLIFIVGLITILDLGFPLFNHRKQKEGLYHKIYIMYKFRTSLPKKKVTDSKIFTKVSQFIDVTRLNELPQLLNVIKGDMSLVGPRPFIPNDATLPKEPPISEKRYMVRPGITGLFQIHGGNHIDKLKFDEIYYDNFGFKQDFLIIMKTPIALAKYIKYTYKKRR